MFLLAEFKEKKAFPYLLSLLRLPEEDVDFIFGDTLTEDLKRILLSTFNGKNMQMLLDIIENQELFEWARAAALDAYMFLYMEGYVSREEFISYIRSLIYDKLRGDESYVMNTAIVGCIIDTHRIEDKYDLLEMYPKNSPQFTELYEKEAVDIDRLVYKALRHRAIPIWVKRDLDQEQLGKIDYLNEALKLFLDKCEREQITSFSGYDKQYMIHYQSAKWVGTLIDLTDEYKFPRIADIRKTAADTLNRFN